MKTVTQDEKTGRRALLASSGAMLAGLGLLAGAGATGLAADSPDAELIADCALYCEHARRVHAVHPSGESPIEDDDARELALEPISERLDEIGDRICTATALTVEGHRARAMCFIAMDGAEYFETSLRHLGAAYPILGALVRDLAGMES